MQGRSFASHLFFRKYGERHLEITASFNGMQFKKKPEDGDGGVVFGVFVHFGGVFCYSISLLLGMCLYILLCSGVGDSEINESQRQWAGWGGEQDHQHPNLHYKYLSISNYYL